MALLATHLPDIEVWAYGSQVNERSHEGSDLALVLRGENLKKIPADWLDDFEEAIRDSSIPFLVEIRDGARIPERFHSQTERQYVLIIPAKQSQSASKIEEVESNINSSESTRLR